MTMHNDTHTLLRRIAAGYSPAEDDFAKLNGLQSAVREFAAMPADQRRTQGYDYLAKMGASRGEIALILNSNEAAMTDVPEPKLKSKPSTLRDLMARTYPPRHWFIEFLLSRGLLHLLLAESGTGKTWEALDIGRSVARGDKWAGKYQCTKSIVGYLDLEATGQDLQERLKLMSLAKPFTDDELDRFHIWTDEGAVDICDPATRAEIQAHFVGLGVELLIVDTLKRTHAKDENSNSEMSVVLAALEGMARDTGMTLLVLHHTGHAEKGRSRGGSVIKDFMQHVIVLSKVDEFACDIALTKAKHGREIKRIARATRHTLPNGGLRIDYDTDANDAPEPSKERNAGQKYVLRYLTTHGPSTVDAITSAADTCSGGTARNAVFTLANEGEIKRIDSGGSGKTATYAISDKPVTSYQTRD